MMRRTVTAVSYHFTVIDGIMEIKLVRPGVGVSCGYEYHLGHVSRSCYTISTRWAGAWDANHAEYQIGIAVIEKAFSDKVSELLKRRLRDRKFLKRSCSS